MKPQDLSEKNEQDDPRSEFEPEFTEIEIGRFSAEEYEAAQRRHEQFLAWERIEHERLERELEEELVQLFSLCSPESAD